MEPLQTSSPFFEHIVLAVLKGAPVPEGKATPVPVGRVKPVPVGLNKPVFDGCTPPVGAAAKPDENEKEFEGASCRRTMSRGAVFSKGAAEARRVVRLSKLVRVMVFIFGERFGEIRLGMR